MKHHLIITFEAYVTADTPGEAVDKALDHYRPSAFCFDCDLYPMPKSIELTAKTVS